MNIISTVKQNSYLGSIAIIVAMTWWFIPEKKVEVIEDVSIMKSVEDIEVRYTDIHPESIKTEAVSWGTTEPIRYSKVKTEKEGRVEKVYLKQGDSIKEGELILKIDTKKLEKDRDYYKQLVRETRIKLDAYKQLNKANSVSEIDLVSAKTRYDEAISRLEDANDSIRKSKVAAPFDGVVGDMDIEQGDFLSKNSFVANVYNLEQVKVIISLPERYINQVKLGQKTVITINKTDRINGEVSYISRIASDENHMFNVEIKSDKKDDLYSGATARAEIALNSIQGYIIKSSSLAVNDDDQMGIKVIDDNKVKFIPVKVIKAVDDKLTISGPVGKLKLITTGADWVSDGENVIGFKEDK